MGKKVVTGDSQVRLFPAISVMILFLTFISIGFGWDSDWHYRTELSVFNPGATDLSDIQVPINLSYNPAMQSDFSDLMFTYVNAAAESEVPYWIEEKADSQWAYIWLRVPHIAALSNSSLFVYYHGPALNKSNIGAAFIFGDDFSSDTSTNYLYNGTIEFSDGYLRLTGPSYIHPFGQQPTANIIVEARTNRSESDSTLAYSGVYALSDNVTIYGYNYSNFPDYPQTQKAKYGGNSTFQQLCYDDGTTYCKVSANLTYTPSEFQRISLYATSDSNKKAQFNQDINASTGSWSTASGQFGYITDTNAQLDWFIVRRYSPLQPTVYLGTEEEYSNLSIALNYPANGAVTETTSLITFSYTPIATNYNLVNCSFHAYIPGFTTIDIANYSEVINGAENLFNLTNVPYTILYWTVECVDDFYSKYDTSLFSENRTLIVSQPAPAPVATSGGGGGYVTPAAVVGEETVPEPEAIEETVSESVAEEQPAASSYEQPIEQTTVVTGQAILTTGNIVAGLLVVLIALVSTVFLKLRKKA